MKERETLSRPQSALLAVGLACGAWLRVRDVPGAFLFGDEFHSLRHLRLGWHAVLTTFEDNGSGLALPLLQRLLVEAFGFDNWSVRLPALLGSLGALALVYPAARLFVGARAALVATLLVAVNGLDVFYGHFGRAYSLAALLVLALLIHCGRLAGSETARRRDIAGIALTLALLPWVHLAALGSALAILAGSAAQLALEPLRRKRLRHLLLASALGAAGAALLQLPALASTWEFVQRKTEREQYYGSFGPFDVLVVLTGHWTLALALGACAVLGAGLLLARRRWATLPLVFAAGAPWVALWVTHPFGDAYAYARYLMPAAAPLAMLAAHALTELTTNAIPRRAAAAVTVVGALFAGAVFLRGPLGLAHRPDGPYANTYLGLLPLPAFDVAFPETPAFYRQLAERATPVTVVEAPALLNRSRQLYRNYYLQHGQRTVLGFLPEDFDAVPSGPYVSVSDADALRASGADYLILHRDALAEAARYWSFVQDLASKRAAAPGERALMERQREYGRNLPRPSAALVAHLQQRFGPPVYSDRDVFVFSVGTRR